MRYILSVVTICLAMTINAQNGFEHILQTVEANNTTLKAMKEKANADKVGNKTGINMANPEVEFGYLWGSPDGTGNRTDFSVTQSFDFPTVYANRSKLTNMQNEQVDIVYEQERRNILHEARIICIEYVYLKKQNNILTERLSKAKDLADAYQLKFDKGDIDIIEYNKTKLHLLTSQKLLQMNEVELNATQAELERLNGGISLEINLPVSYSEYILPLNFDNWLASIEGKNPVLQQADMQIMLSKQEEKLTRSMNLPKFSAGYASEYILGTSSQGFTIGVSIPLWEGKNTVKHKKAQTIALQAIQWDNKLQFRNETKKEYDKATRLALLLKEYKSLLNISNNDNLLKKSFDKGQLSLINYLLELSEYYDTIDTYLETERDYQLSVAELEKWN